MSAHTVRLRELFDAALELPPEERPRFLLEQCTDPADRHAVERLLAADALDGDPWAGISIERLSASIDELDADAAHAWAPGRRIGEYELIEPIGEGGSSTVFLAARDLDGARQEVALKLMRRGVHSPETRRLLRRERRALVALSHPNIAHLIDGGVTDSGLPYLVMEHVDGVPITQFALARDLDVRALLQLMSVVCRAVAVAHRNLIVHRDLKPSNILVAADGTVKLLDFGIAKLLDDDLADATGAGYTPMTPGYAAPEQFTGGAISTATDVYSLGVLLHELLLRERPVGRFVRRPSLRAVDLPTDRRPAKASSQTLRRALAGDLDNIVIKALADEPERRYAGAAEMADDIGRFLDGHPVRAHPPSPGYRARKFLTRHRGAALATLALVVVVMASLAAALWQARAVQRQADIAAREAQRANAVRGFLEGLFEPINDGVAERKLPTIKDLVGIGVDRVKADADLAPAERIDLLTMFARLYGQLGEDARSRELGAEAEGLAGKTLPPAHPAAIAARVLRARQALDHDDHATAETILRDALAQVHAGGDTDPALVGIMDELSVIEMDAGRPEEALALERAALAERIRREGPDAKSVATGYSNLAYGLVGVGQFEEAAKASERTYEIDRRYRDPDSYDVLSSLSTWGWALVQAGHIGAGNAKLRAADTGFRALGGKPRSMQVNNLLKVCMVDVRFGTLTEARTTCGESLALTRDVTGGSGMYMGFALRAEASRLMEAGDLDGAAEHLQQAWQNFPDTPENREGRASLHYLQAMLEWLRKDAGTTRHEALQARDGLAGFNNLWVARLNSQALLLLACSAVPHGECPAALDQDVERAINAVRNVDDPHLLLPRIVLARESIDRDPVVAARNLDRAIESAAKEMNDRHPMIDAARIWRSLALDHAGRCEEADRSLPSPSNEGAERAGYPWLIEAMTAYRRDKRC